MKLSSIKLNEKNPRVIKDDNFQKLCESIKKFPKMMQLRPIIVDDDNIIQGGNMRYKALIELGFDRVPDEWVKRAGDFTKEEIKEFVLKDNLSYGEWDFDMVEDIYSDDELTDIGFDLLVDIPDMNGDEETLPDNYFQKFEVIAECSDEESQKRAFDLLTLNGYTCRVLQL